MARPQKSLTILPDPSSLQLLRLEADEQSNIAVVATTSSGALCPLCQCHSESIHTRYTRMATDLPWARWAERLEPHVLPCFSPEPEKTWRAFTERLPSSAESHTRRTTR